MTFQVLLVEKPVYGPVDRLFTCHAKSGADPDECADARFVQKCTLGDQLDPACL